MTQDEIIRMAREAGFADGVVEIVGLLGFHNFAALVAAHEREACAKVCDDLVLEHPGRADLTAEQCAAAIREALLEQPAEQEPVELFENSEQLEPRAWMYTLEYGNSIANTKVSLHQLNYPFGVCGSDYLKENKDGISYVRQTPLAPPQREWVSLSDDEIREAVSGDPFASRIDVARVIEAKLKEKNK